MKGLLRRPLVPLALGAIVGVALGGTALAGHLGEGVKATQAAYRAAAR
jgi:hypothetical protein